MTGGAGKDIFKFTALTDLGLDTKDTQDVIEDFSRVDGDKIDFSALKGTPGLTRATTVRSARLPSSCGGKPCRMTTEMTT